MKKLGAFIAGGIIVLALIWLGVYNGLVTKSERIKQNWGQVENTCQRRLDLIPNLVNTVKGYAKHEKEIFEKVAEVRSKIGSFNLSGSVFSNPDAQKNFLEVQGQLGMALSRLIAVAENYPQLKANENFAKLQDDIAGTENRISVERKKFQEAVEAYNASIRRFPAFVVAKVHEFKAVEYFKSDEGASKAPVVNF